MDPGVAGGVAAVAVAAHLGRCGSKGVHKGGKPLRAQLVAIADEEGAAHEAGVEQAAEQLDRNKRLAGAGGERQQRALLAAGDLLKDSADRGVLVVAAAPFAEWIRREQGARRRRIEVDANGGLPAHAQLIRRGQSIERRRIRGEAGGGVEADELMAIGREDERDVEAARVGLGLLKTGSRVA